MWRAQGETLERRLCCAQQQALQSRLIGCPAWARRQKGFCNSESTARFQEVICTVLQLEQPNTLASVSRNAVSTILVQCRSSFQRFRLTTSHFCPGTTPPRCRDQKHWNLLGTCEMSVPGALGIPGAYVQHFVQRVLRFVSENHLESGQVHCLAA